jgi:hypothetical protein
MKYNIIKELPVNSLETIFNGLKNGDLKLLYFNAHSNNVSQVSHSSKDKIEIITIENDKIVAQYYMSFHFRSVVEMKCCGCRSFTKTAGWFIGRIEN